MKRYLALFILLAGVGLFLLLLGLRGQPAKAPQEAIAAPVEVLKVQPKSEQIRVTGYGTVVPAREISLTSEVSGRIVEVHPEFQPGGVVPSGETIVKIDPRDFKLAVTQAEAQVESAAAALAVEKGRAVVAKREFALLSEKSLSPLAKELSLRAPQLREREAALESVKSQREIAKLRLERTEVTVPYETLIRERNVEVGGYVTPQSTIATVVDTSLYHIRVALPVDMLRYLPPEVLSDGKARVFPSAEGDEVFREAKILELLGDVEATGRLARVLVGVSNPRVEPDNGEFPLLINSYVRVELLGEALQEVFVLPRQAVRGESSVWLVDEEGLLEERPVKILFRREGEVVVGKGLSPSERVVTSSLPGATPGMKLEVVEEVSI